MILAIVLPALVIGIVLVRFDRAFKQATHDTTDLRRYPAILRDLAYPDGPVLAHLPATVPSSATSVRFYYQPPFLQGGTRLQLRMVLPADEVSAALQAAKPAAKEVQNGGSDFDALNDHKGLLPSALFRDATNTTFASLPEDFHVFILDAKTTSQPTWNHGYSYGIAINEQLSEVIYWLEDW